MENSPRRVLVAMITLAFIVTLTHPLAAGELDGRSFEGTTGETGSQAGEPDTLVFADGTFRSTGCDQWGFGAVTYTAEEVDGEIRFEATTTSAEEGEIHWKGVVKGNQADATYVWSKEGQESIEYWFEGAEID